QRIDVPATPAIFPTSLALADVSGDGKPDLLITDDGVASVLLGNGDGTFRTKVDHRTAAGPDSILVADVDRDDKLDLVVLARIDKRVSVLLGNGDGTFRVSVDSPVIPSPERIAVGDVTGDGK